MQNSDFCLPILDMASRSKHHSVYVIGLDKAVMDDKRFREANPYYVEGKPCVYVGRIGLAPDERFRNHKLGHKSSRYPHKYGMYLQRKLYEHLNPMSYEQACNEEEELAKRLRSRGYAVWQK